MGGSNDKEKCYAKLRRVDYFLTLEEYVGKPTRTVEEELREMWNVQSTIVELHSSHRKLEWAFNDEGWVWGQHERDHIWRYFSMHVRQQKNPSPIVETAFETWLRQIKETGQFLPYFAHHTPEGFLSHCKEVSIILLEKYKNNRYRLTKDEALSLAAIINPVGIISVEFFLRGAMDETQKHKFSFTSVLTYGYTGLVKLARTCAPVERTYFWESFLIDGIFGKPGQELLKPDEYGFRGAVSRTFVHATQDIERVLLWKNDWKNLVVYEVEEREEDQGGIRSGVQFPIFDNFVKESKTDSLRIYPPLTTFQVKRHYTCRFPVESVSSKASDFYSEETNPLEITFIVLEPLYSPTSHLPQIVPTEEIWDAVRLGKGDEIRKWIKQNPTVNLEYIHPVYQCSLLYSASRFGHLSSVSELVRGCAHVNSKSSKSQSTPLHVACYYGYEEIVSFLLQQGADPTIQNKHGLLPIQEVPVNRPSILELLSSWKRPAEKRTGSKLVGSYLVYGDRIHYLKGLTTLLGNPVLSMKDEFSRNLIFYEKASGYHKTFEVYNAALEALDELKKLPEAKLLTSEEILALRIYTGPFYIVVNQYLRELHQANNKQKNQLLSKHHSWVSTILHLNSGLRKLAAIAKNFPVTYRGVDKQLRPDFFVPDPRGMISATEFGFMSTSTGKSHALEFCGDSEATLLCIHPRMEDASGYHMGASLSWCSEYPTEDEILFPPLTMFEVLKRKRENNFIKITVIPTFV